MAISSNDIFDAASQSIRAALTVEDGFLLVGHELGEAGTTLERVAGVFHGLHETFQDETLADAAANLTSVSDRITALGDALSGTRGVLEQLTASTGTVARRLERLQQAVRSIQMLTINARIEATALAGSGVDFSTFTSEITRLLSGAQESLTGFDRELQALSGRIREAGTAQAGFEARRADATRSILARLQDGAGAVGAQHARAAAGAAAIDAQSRQVAGRIGSAVMALQIGDIARQRIEHAEQAFATLVHHGTGAADGDRLAVICCRLQAAQLDETARDLGRAIDSMAAAHRGLADDARAIAQHGTAAFKAATSDHGAAQTGLEASVRGALDTLEHYRHALAGVERLVAAVTDAVAGLGSHVKMIQALESSIRIMGLNTTLKCARLGKDGAALSAIAQELRGFGHQTSEDADEITARLKTIVDLAGALGAGDTGRTAAATASLGETMTRSLDRLIEARSGLDSALTALRGDCDRVAAMLERTIPKIRAQEHFVGLLDRAVAGLTAIADGAERDIADLTGAERALLAEIAGRYTMASERRIHDAMVAAWDGDKAACAEAAAPVPAVPVPAADPDDFLF